MWLERQYIYNLSSYLKNFKETTSDIFNFRCPLCGDSKKSQSKSRAYLICENGKFRFYCHNCHASHKFYHFLKTVNPHLFQEYLRDMYRERTDKQWINRPKLEIKHSNPTSILPLLKLKKISSLEYDHPAKIFVTDRKIPNIYHAWLFYAPKFKEFTNSFMPDKYKNTTIDEDRIIIPLLGKKKELLGFQGRAVSKVEARERYITILLNSDNPKLFGLDRVNFNEKNYVVEGPFDSMFLNNAIATCGGKITTELEKGGCPTHNSVIVYDNQPRNPDVVRNIEQAIDNGYRVCIWPEEIKEKDINDMILSRNPLTPEDVRDGELYIQDIIDRHTHTGLAAKLRFVKWKKI